MPTLTKNDLARFIKKRGYCHDITYPVAEQMVEDIFEFISEHMAKGDTVRIKNFGTFYLKHRKAQAGRNLHTMELVPVKARLVPAVKFSRILREKVI